MTKKYSSNDEYIESFSGVTGERLKKLREIILRLYPEATQRISYNIPAFFTGKNMIVYFAGYENHVSLYPGRAGVKIDGLEKYQSGKSTLKFPNDKPLPIGDIEAFIKDRIKAALS